MSGSPNNSNIQRSSKNMQIEGYSIKDHLKFIVPSLIGVLFL